MSAIGSAPAAARAHAQLVLVRHGESIWNRSLRLTGWTDVPLSRRGRDQAERAGIALRGRGIAVDACYSSHLRRASQTRDILLKALIPHDRDLPPVRESWRLNERHYGALQGLRWWDAVWRFGWAPVQRCLRDPDCPPPPTRQPPTGPLDARVPAADEPEWREAQSGESVADAVRRLLPLWTGEIAPALRGGASILVVAHNNLLRGMTRHLESGSGGLPPRFRTAQPWLLQLDPMLAIVRREAL